MTGTPIDAMIAKSLNSIDCDWSIDRVIVDPDWNEQFIRACRANGLNEDAAILNRRLMNLRKASLLKRNRRTKRTSFPDETDYRFASEIAVRALERRLSCSLDQILCDPQLLSQFDTLAAEIAPGFSVVQYRWAALNLRKARKLAPEILGRVIRSVKVLRFSLDQINVTDLPEQQGLYVFHEAQVVLYVGEAQQLRNRLKRHLDHSDNKGLARWLWENGTNGVFLELHTLPDETPTSFRKALETEMIRSRRPLFNVQR